LAKEEKRQCPMAPSSGQKKKKNRSSAVQKSSKARGDTLSQKILWINPTFGWGPGGVSCMLPQGKPLKKRPWADKVSENGKKPEEKREVLEESPFRPGGKDS